MERKPNVLIVESTVAISKRLMDPLNELDRIAEISFVSTAEKAYNFILSKKTDVVIWGIELNSIKALKLTQLREDSNPFSLIIIFDNEDDCKNGNNYIAADIKSQSSNSKFFNYSQTYLDKFLKDPLF